MSAIFPMTSTGTAALCHAVESGCGVSQWFVRLDARLT